MTPDEQFEAIRRILQIHQQTLQVNLEALQAIADHLDRLERALLRQKAEVTL